MRSAVAREGLRDSRQDIDHAQTMSNNYGNAQPPSTQWRQYNKDNYNERLVENQVPDPLSFRIDIVTPSVRRPSSEPLTPHYRTKRMQRSGTEESPRIKTESVMMSHTSAFLNQDSHLSGLDAQASTPGRAFQQQADTVQPLRNSRGSASTALEAEIYHPNYGPTNARNHPAIYQPVPYPQQFSYSGPNEFSEPTNPRTAEQSRVSAPDPLFYSSPHPRHQDKSLRQPRYDAPRHDSRVQQYHEAVAPQYSTQFNNLPPDIMSLSYDQRQFPEYPPPMMHESHHSQDQDDMQHPRYPSPPPPLSENPYNPQPNLDAPITMDDLPELRQKSESDAPSPGRSKPIPKPDREVTKDADGRFVCTWPGCTEEIRNFGRKCEWSKHMDKHDRPYKCPSEGCEKLPGFTYSGGLLRHQREVHNLHGGPRKQLNCPHPTCKRYSGKGFSRQENLNEHLRRVHTDGSEMPVPEDLTEDDGTERSGMKRKRGSAREDDFDWRQEVARLRQENEEMKRTTENLMRQLQSLQGIVGSSIQRAQQSHQAPPANML